MTQRLQEEAERGSCGARPGRTPCTDHRSAAMSREQWADTDSKLNLQKTSAASEPEAVG